MGWGRGGGQDPFVWGDKIPVSFQNWFSGFACPAVV